MDMENVNTYEIGYSTKKKINKRSSTTFMGLFVFEIGGNFTYEETKIY